MFSFVFVFLAREAVQTDLLEMNTNNNAQERI